MKFLLLAAFLASVSAVSIYDWLADQDVHIEPRSSQYESGKEYVYRFQSQVLTSLPTYTNTYAGIKVISKVRMAVTGTHAATFKMENIQLYSLNTEIGDPNNLKPFKQLPQDHFTPLPATHAQMIISKLSLPIKFTCKQGRINSMQITDQEVNWSLDIKRSVLMMLQLRLKNDDFTINPKLLYNDLQQNNSTVFDFEEPGLDGTCHSEITVHPTLGDGTLFKVVKTRDPTHCLKVNSIWKTTWGQKAANCDCTENLNKRSCQCKPVNEDFDSKLPEYSEAKTITECEVKSEDQVSHVIKKCTQSAHYKYLFPGSVHQYLSTLSNQTLGLIEENDVQTVQTGSHTFKNVDQPWKQQILKDDEEKPMLQQQQVMTVVRSMLSELLTISNNKERFDDHLTVFTQLVEMLKLCKQQQLQTLFTETKESGWRKWKLYVDALAHTNKTITDTFLLDKIVSGEITQNEAVPLLITWAADKIGTKHVLDKFVQSVIPAFEGKSDKKLTYQHVLLSFGSMVRRFVHFEETQLSQCVLEHDRNQHRQNIAYSRKYEKVLEGKLSNVINRSGSDEQKITLLKAMTNIGSIEALPQLQQLLANKESTAVRVHAVYALKSLAYQNRLKVLQTVEPLLQNHHEDSEVRMAAFIITLHCKPSLTQMHHMLNNEPDLDFKTFTVKFMKNILTLRSKEFENRQKWIAQVLKGVRAFQMSPQSQSVFMEYRLRPEGEGDLMSFGSLTNQTSAYPRTAFYRHDVNIRGRLYNQAEFGYRAEGLENIIAQFTNQESAIRRHQDLDVLREVSSRPEYSSLAYKRVKPSITLYVKSTDRHVAFLHFDENTINRYILQGKNEGKIEIPVKIFQTWVSKPEQNQKLQPHGMWQVNEKAHLLILDLEGKIQIKVENGQLPEISFVSSRPLRMEDKEFQAQYVKCGFTHTGVTTAMTRRVIQPNNQWNMTYSWQKNNFTYSIINPTDELKRVELNAYTNTFVLPMRLTEFVPRKELAFRDIRTDESDRRIYSQQIQCTKSVDIDTQVEANVYMPELYSFVRDRMPLLPIRISFHKQQIKVTAKPLATTQQVYQVTLATHDLTNQMLMGQQISSYLSQQQQQQQQTSQQGWQQEQGWQQQQQQQTGSMYKEWLGELFGRASQKATQPPETPEPVVSGQRFLRPSQFLKPTSIGAIRTLYQAQIKSISRDQYKAMVANFTTQAEHDVPTVRSILIGERPPVPGQERERVILRIDTTDTYNPSVNQILTTHTIEYGDESQQNKPAIDILKIHTPTYKDNVCYEENAYGCKDQYGVTYPVWYNLTAQIRYKNTQLPLRMYKNLQPYITNIAQAVTMELAGEKPQPQPLFRTGQQQDLLNASFLFKPMDNMMDVQYNREGLRYNLSRTYLPMDRSFYQMMYASLTYPMGRVASISDSLYVPRHHRTGPFTWRDVCVVGNSRVYSIDEKEIQMPRSDCEVLLLGDCGTKQRELMVSLKPSSPRSSLVEKVLKVVLGEKRVELQFNPATTFARTQVKVRINGQPQQLDQYNQLLIEEGRRPTEAENKVVGQPFAARQEFQMSSQQMSQTGQPLALVQCDGYKCTLRSRKHGLFVSIDSQKVKVEVDSRKSPYMCGICSRHPEIPQLASDEASINIFKANRLFGDQQCTMSEIIEPSQSENVCRKSWKHKLMHTPSNGKVMHCISVSAVPLCNNKCAKKAIKVEKHDFRCVTDEEARKLEIAPSMQGEEYFMADDQMNRLMTQLSKAMTITREIPVAQSCE